MFETITGAQWLSAGSNVLGKALESKPGGPSNAINAAQFENPFDASGWNVNFGGGTINSDRQQTTEAASLQGEFARWLPVAAGVLGVVLLWRMVRR